MAVPRVDLLLLVVSRIVILGAALEKRPNFIVFFVDDMGVGDLQVFGAPTTTTTNIDAMAMEGI